MKIVFPLLAPLLAVVALALAAPLAYPSGRVSATDAKHDQPVPASSLIVHVVDLQSGMPLARVQVKITPIGPTDPVWMGLTNARGTLKTGDLDAGTYLIHAERNGLFADQVVRLKLNSEQHVTIALGDQ